jgi:hypothetical protein
LNSHFESNLREAGQSPAMGEAGASPDFQRAALKIGMLKEAIPFNINNLHNRRCLLPARLRLHSGKLVQVGASLQLL